MTEPLYRSFDEYLAATTMAQRRAWCQRKAKKANQPRLLSNAPDVRLTADDVLTILMDAKGRCAHCGSLSVEARPSNEKGHPIAWEPVGRRIGSLDHADSRVGGGSNSPANLRWSCLWCNVWPNQRVPGAIDHGAVQDGSLPATEPGPERFTRQQIAEIVTAETARRQAPLDEVPPPPEDIKDYDPFDADRWAETTDPDDPDYLQGTAMSRD